MNINVNDLLESFLNGVEAKQDTAKSIDSIAKALDRIANALEKSGTADTDTETVERPRTTRAKKKDVAREDAPAVALPSFTNATPVEAGGLPVAPPPPPVAPPAPPAPPVPPVQAPPVQTQAPVQVAPVPEQTQAPVQVAPVQVAPVPAQTSSFAATGVMPAEVYAAMPVEQQFSVLASTITPYFSKPSVRDALESSVSSIGASLPLANQNDRNLPGDVYVSLSQEARYYIFSQVSAAIASVVGAL